jgi:hypothetical protein
LCNQFARELVVSLENGVQAVGTHIKLNINSAQMGGVELQLEFPFPTFQLLLESFSHGFAQFVGQVLNLSSAVGQLGVGQGRTGGGCAQSAGAGGVAS